MVEVRPDFGFLLNGRPVKVSGERPQLTLLDFIRSRGLTGAKEGCAEGECGACAVLMANPGSAPCAVNSCLIPLPAAADREIFTVESLAHNGELNEVQRAMAASGGSQCGYCTPGFVISMTADRRNVDSLGGNLCRCTGYRPIHDALKSLDPQPPFPGGAGGSAFPHFTYAAPEGRYSSPASLAECLSVADEHPGARYVAGNTDLGVLTNLRDERFAHLIAVGSIPELRIFEDASEAVEIGAALTLSEIAEHWTEAPQVFHDWLELFASLLIRNRATLGGNLATASPIGDSAPLLLALDAVLRIATNTGERTIPLTDFYRGYRVTALEPGELLVSILIPKPFPDIIRFFKVAKRRMDDISTVAAAIAMDRAPSGTVTRVRIAFGGVAATPVRAFDAEQALERTAFNSQDLQRAKESVRRTVNPIDDHRGSAAYRLAIAQNLIEKFHHEVTA